MAKFSKKYVARLRRRARSRKNKRRSGPRAKGIRKIVKKEIRKMAEDKYQVTVDEQVQTSSAFVSIYIPAISLPTIQQGVTRSQRIGNQIMIKTWMLKISALFNAQLFSAYRIVVAKPKLNQDVTTMDAFILTSFAVGVGTLENLKFELEPNTVCQIIADTGLRFAGGPSHKDVNKSHTFYAPRQKLTFLDNSVNQPSDRYPKFYFLYFNTTNDAGLMFCSKYVWEDV